MAVDGKQLKLDEVSTKSDRGALSGNMVSDIFISLHLSICASAWLSFCHLPVCLSVCLSAHFTVCVSHCLAVTVLTQTQC